MNRIREERQRLGWTQKELARRARVSIRTISSIDAGRTARTRYDIRRRILRALGVPFEEHQSIFEAKVAG